MVGLDEIRARGRAQETRGEEEESRD